MVDIEVVRVLAEERFEAPPDSSLVRVNGRDMSAKAWPHSEDGDRGKALIGTGALSLSNEQLRRILPGDPVVAIVDDAKALSDASAKVRAKGGSYAAAETERSRKEIELKESLRNALYDQMAEARSDGDRAALYERVQVATKGERDRLKERADSKQTLVKTIPYDVEGLTSAASRYWKDYGLDGPLDAAVAKELVSRYAQNQSHHAKKAFAVDVKNAIHAARARKILSNGLRRDAVELWNNAVGDNDNAAGVVPEGEDLLLDEDARRQLNDIAQRLEAGIATIDASDETSGKKGHERQRLRARTQKDVEAILRVYSDAAVGAPAATREAAIRENRRHARPKRAPGGAVSRRVETYEKLLRGEAFDEPPNV
ncbi:hypothetical protein EON77_12225, partial [bacterium]